MRGSAKFSSFAIGKFSVRALSQSLAREFGPQKIHVVHSIIDGSIVTDRSRERYGREAAARFDDRSQTLSPDSIAKSYMYLINQDRSAWTQGALICLSLLKYTEPFDEQSWI